MWAGNLGRMARKKVDISLDIDFQIPIRKDFTRLLETPRNFKFLVNALVTISSKLVDRLIDSPAL